MATQALEMSKTRAILMMIAGIAGLIPVGFALYVGFILFSAMSGPSSLAEVNGVKKVETVGDTLKVTTHAWTGVDDTISGGALFDVGKYLKENPSEVPDGVNKVEIDLPLVKEGGDRYGNDISTGIYEITTSIDAINKGNYENMIPSDAVKLADSYGMIGTDGKKEEVNLCSLYGDAQHCG